MIHYNNTAASTLRQHDLWTAIDGLAQLLRGSCCESIMYSFVHNTSTATGWCAAAAAVVCVLLSLAIHTFPVTSCFILVTRWKSLG
jgi:hypothetical protein